MFWMLEWKTSADARGHILSLGLFLSQLTDFTVYATSFQTIKFQADSQTTAILQQKLQLIFCFCQHFSSIVVATFPIFVAHRKGRTVGGEKHKKEKQKRHFIKGTH